MNNTKSEKKKESNYMKITLSYILMIFFFKKKLETVFFFFFDRKKIVKLWNVTKQFEGSKVMISDFL